MATLWIVISYDKGLLRNRKSVQLQLQSNNRYNIHSTSAQPESKQIFLQLLLDLWFAAFIQKSIANTFAKNIFEFIWVFANEFGSRKGNRRQVEVKIKRLVDYQRHGKNASDIISRYFQPPGKPKMHATKERASKNSNHLCWMWQRQKL